MFERLFEMLRAPAPATPTDQPFQRRQLAMAVLLLEASQIDRQVLPEERAKVVRLLCQRFNLAPGGGEALVQAAEVSLAEALDDWVFAQAVREGFDAQERREIVGLLWEVVYADGQLDRFEKSLVARIAAEIGVPPEATVAERDAVLGRLKLKAAT